jgi:hypothetical protein
MQKTVSLVLNESINWIFRLRGSIATQCQIFYGHACISIGAWIKNGFAFSDNWVLLLYSGNLIFSRMAVKLDNSSKSFANNNLFLF